MSIEIIDDRNTNKDTIDKVVSDFKYAFFMKSWFGASSADINRFF